jgi:hypothetical protein
MEVIVRMTKVNPWTGLIKWSNCFDYLGSYWTRSGSRYTGLTKEQQADMESKLRFEPGTLSPDSAYWDTFAIKIGKNDLIINTDTPEGELQYLFLKGHKRVAVGLNKVSPSTDYVLINKEAEAEQTNRVNKVKRDAFRSLDKMNLEEMRKCLRLFGVKADTLSNEMVEAKLTELIEKDPAKYIRIWVENPNKEFNYMVEEALSKNIIRKNRSAYYFGTDLIGNGIDDVIAYLKDKKNQDILLSIKKEIESK